MMAVFGDASYGEIVRREARALRYRSEVRELKAREELAGGFLKRWGRNVERRLQELSPGPFVAGDALHVADLKLYLAARWFSSGVVDHVPRDVFAEFPRLVGLERAVADHPKVVAWRNR